MLQPRHLVHAPIIEAILDFKVQLRAGFDVQRLKAEMLGGGRYSLTGEKTVFSTHLDIEDGVFKQGGETHGVGGFVYNSIDGRFMAQATLEGCTISHFSPYSCWAELEGEARLVWEEYQRAAEPVFVSRVGTRFINRLRIPLPVQDLAQYIAVLPKLPRDFVGDANAFLVRLSLNRSDAPVSVYLTIVSESETDEQHLAVILDIDAYSRESYTPDSADMWAVLSRLHEVKNEAFFGSITEKTLELLS